MLSHSAAHRQTGAEQRPDVKSIPSAQRSRRRQLAVLVVAVALGCRSEPEAADNPGTAPSSAVSAAVSPAARASVAASATSAPSEAAPFSDLPEPVPDWVSVRAAPDCPSDMVSIEGQYCPFVGHRCDEWLQKGRDRCQRYDPKPICEGRLEPRRFCIDRYEYPNVRGALPVVMVSWVEADAACKADGKRLCTESEWTFACETETRWPHPYGFERDAGACNIDRGYRFPDFDAFSNPRKVPDEVDRLDQRLVSGARPRCVSSFGVYDMTGNVDEWVVNEKGKPDVSALKGGYWGPIRARCRPVTRFHNRWFRFYQIGFRCCADPAPADR